MHGPSYRRSGTSALPGLLNSGQAAAEPTPQHQEQGAPRKGCSKSCRCLWAWG